MTISDSTGSDSSEKKRLYMAKYNREHEDGIIL
jgi:hypothetical protein